MLPSSNTITGPCFLKWIEHALCRGADLDAEDLTGRTPLQYAALGVFQTQFCIGPLLCLLAPLALPLLFLVSLFLLHQREKGRGRGKMGDLHEDSFQLPHRNWPLGSNKSLSQDLL